MPSATGGPCGAIQRVKTIAETMRHILTSWDRCCGVGRSGRSLRAVSFISDISFIIVVSSRETHLKSRDRDGCSMIISISCVQRYIRKTTLRLVKTTYIIVGGSFFFVLFLIGL
jgi:hypothetical protein